MKQRRQIQETFTNVWRIFVQAIPVFVMISLIPLIRNDYVLLGVYAAIIAVSLVIRYDHKDWLFLVFGCLIMIVSESLFVSTGVESFERNSLFGLMPVWLPVLWAYAFVVMKRTIRILDA